INTSDELSTIVVTSTLSTGCRVTRSTSMTLRLRPTNVIDEWCKEAKDAHMSDGRPKCSRWLAASRANRTTSASKARAWRCHRRLGSLAAVALLAPLLAVAAEPAGNAATSDLARGNPYRYYTACSARLGAQPAHRCPTTGTKGAFFKSVDTDV